MIPLEAEVIRPADLELIKNVLERATGFTFYNLIISKLSKRLYDKLCKDNREKLKILLVEMTFQLGENRDRSRLLLLLRDDKLCDAEN